MKNIEFKNDIATLKTNSFDATQKSELPCGVYYPKSVEELATVVKYFYENDTKFLIRGAGSGFVGGVVPQKNSFVVSVEKFNKIISLNKQKKRVIVEVGIVNGELNRFLRKENLLFTPDPASKDFSSVGGNISNNSGGLNTRKFGVTRESIRGLKLIKPNGEIVLTGEFHPQNQNLVLQHLAIGSEGTLFIIAEAILSLEVLEERAESFIITADNRTNLFMMINKVLSNGIVPETFEFIQKEIIDLLQKNGKIEKYPQIFNKNIALIKYNGKNISKIETIINNLDCKMIRFTNSSDGDRIWGIRRDISQTVYGVGDIKINEDISVPIDKLNAFFDGLEKLKQSFDIFCFGHAGDGNIHVNIMVNGDDEKKVAQSRLNELFSLVVSLRGTITGEHGVGTNKKPYFNIEHSKEEIEKMRKIKRFIDNKSLFNINKIFEV